MRLPAPLPTPMAQGWGALTAQGCTSPGVACWKQQSLQQPRAQLSCTTSARALAWLTCGVLRWSAPRAGL